ncbi:DUF3158 family protein [Pseudomonas koreensis]|uniref:DUF3158 family protein n=1 Tax=Pseudomonas koreensis TaxID=198620 RepID=A0A9X2XEJ9_9PSED|nr:DUF3158 family protein [Pseudomonas koreensis]MCU7247273.1 DUF3158 family protein [Pseudomonas koreensis]
MGQHYYQPLIQADYDHLEHSAYLKGFLKPFKGKGELEDWASQCMTLHDRITGLAQARILARSKQYPFNLLQAQLKPHVRVGTTYLRWRNPDRSSMGVALWQRCIEDKATPNLVIDDLYALEQQRIVLNMQISLTHTLARQAQDCAIKMANAEEVYQRTLIQRGIASGNI